MSTRHLTGGSYRPAPVEIGVGETLIKVDPRGRGQGPLVVEAARGRTAQTLTLRLPPAAPHEQRCLAEVDVDLDDGPWFWGIAQTAVDGLPAAIKTIAMSLRTCDPRFLKQVSGLPIVRRELQVGFAGAEKHLVPGRPREYSRVADLAKDCRHLVFPAGERPAQEPRLLGSVGTGVVRVEANRSGGAVYWRLRWSGHGWLLHGIDFTEFE